MRKDRILHFVVCYAITFITGMLTMDFKLAAILAMVIGLSKEVYDALGYGDPDFYDLLADAAGICFALGSLCLIVYT